MKREQLLKYLFKNGCIVEREGKNHTIIYNPNTNLSSTLPRHNEINTFTGRKICKDLGIKIINIK
ncbi:MAG: addiction module toxin, HicA family [Spirochaetes bacterium GWD1_27_9]|nr:MAG: addiction module toxin, HicA family [Spirochaetes bacterium GWB1_27_13]OHD26219.1 MAG: addiction module toxin, HicA family [Spirochaetes bacterium GWC1_27_15]OHD35559.1 MAG: addiction module toxin, HicA family [Spirochaetes bacterium GWD1_27_9]